MYKNLNKRVSFTFNNQSGMQYYLDWVIVIHAFLCHLIAMYGASWFVISVLHNDELIGEGMVFLKMMMFLLIYVVCIFALILITGFPAVAEWIESKEKERECKIRLL